MSAKAEKRLRRAEGVRKAALREEREFEALVRMRRAQIEERLDDERPAARRRRRVALALVALVVVVAFALAPVFGGR